MSQAINIRMGGVAVGHDNDHITTDSIGSCVVIVLYDREAKVGGMAHAMLASRNLNQEDAESENIPHKNDNEVEAKYVDESIDYLVKEIEKIGGDKKRIVAKLIGGANMFKSLSKKTNGIGFQNTEMAIKHLKKISIPIKSEDIGGTVGKLVDFNVANGLVKVTTKI